MRIRGSKHGHFGKAPVLGKTENSEGEVAFGGWEVKE